MNNLNIKKNFVDGEVLPAQDLNNNFKQIEDGMKSLEGASSYQIAVSNGFVGTEEEWLATLVGPQGPEGPRGPQGDSGSYGGYALATFPLEEGVISISGVQGHYAVEHYNLKKTNNININVAEKSFTGAILPTKCLHIDTTNISLLKVTIIGKVSISNEGDANTTTLETSIYEANTGVYYGRHTISESLSQIQNNSNNEAETLITTMAVFNVSDVTAIELFTDIHGDGIYNIYPFEYFIEGYE